MPKLPISVFIIAKNEADRIDKPILSTLNWVDEVIVIDSGSTDGTVEKSRSLGARVEYHEWQGYGPQKIYGESLCANHWILNLDADEEISPTLQTEIQSLFKHGEPPCVAYRLDIRILLRFGISPHPFAPSNEPIRLYNAKHAGFKDSTVHDSVVLHDNASQTIGQCKHKVIHRCFRSYEHMVSKINFYSTMQAKDRFAKGKNPSRLRILVEPLAAFVKSFILRRYCFYGIDGVIHSIVYAFGRTLRLAKTRELFQEAHYQSSGE